MDKNPWIGNLIAPLQARITIALLIVSGIGDLGFKVFKKQAYLNMAAEKLIRLSQAARKLNVGHNTILDFLGQ